MPDLIPDSTARNSDTFTRAERQGRLGLLLLAVPAIVVTLIAVIAPIGWTLVLSFLDVEGRLSLENYRIVFDQGANLSVFVQTLQIAGLVTLVSVLVGYPLTYLMVGLSQRWMLIILAAVILPYMTSVLVRTYAWVVVLGRRGLINDALQAIGVTSAPIPLLYNTAATVIGMVHYMLPLLVLPLYASMRSIDRNCVLAASGLGARPIVAFWRVFFPLSLPGLAAGAFLIFVISLGFFITPAILGGGRVTMIAQQIATAVTTHASFGVASALGILLLVATSAILFVVVRLFGLNVTKG